MESLNEREVTRFAGRNGTCLSCSLLVTFGSPFDPVIMWGDDAPANRHERTLSHLVFLCWDKDSCEQRRIQR